jgi:hypothetical protein
MSEEPALSAAVAAPPASRPLDVFLGLGLLVFCHIAAGIVTGGIGLIFLGVLQLLYVVPIVFASRRSGRRGIATGLIIGASITFLLNATCWGVLVFSLGSGSFH